MKVVIPHPVQIVAAFTKRSRHLRFLKIVLSDEDDRARGSRVARSASDGADNVLTRSIADGVCRVETEAVEMKFLNPVTPIRNEKLTDRL